MKLSLVNLVPLKELKFDSPAPEGMDIPNFDSLVDALRWKNDLENYSMDLENELKHAQRQFDDKLSGQGERGAEPEGGPIQQKIAGELDQIKSNIQILKKELNTVLAKIDYFDQNHLGEGTDAISTARALPNDRDEEDQENDDNLNMDDTKFEFNMREDKELDKNQQSIAAKWDKESKKLEGGLFDTSRELEKTDTKQFNINVSNKVSFLTKLRDDGKFKSTKITDDKIEGWAINPSVTGYDIASKMKPTTNEGSCGHGPNGVPGNTPGGTKGMPADDRTRGMLKMLIQKEIAKLNEVESKPGDLDRGLEDLLGKDDFQKATNPKLAKLINTAIMSIDPNMSYKEFAKGVAQVLIDDYGVHNYEPFIKELKNALDSTLG